ncbi:MAG: hypothetical protein ACJAS4_002898 [Bacteriovoracaceae bacterium]|jgi:hypothetical protein
MIIFLFIITFFGTTFADSDYSEKQWYLKNTGEPITRRITDIDTLVFQSVKGEDINLGPSTSTSIPKQIRVAIIDSGVDLEHPDLKHSIFKNEEECETLKIYKTCLAQNNDKESCHKQYANIDNDNNGYPLDCNGWSVTNTSYPTVKVSGNPEIKDTQGHGTHVAGIISAADNDLGIKGIHPHVKIIPIQVASNSAQSSPIDSISKGIEYAIATKADIINLSLGWRFKFDTPAIREVIKKAVESNILVVVAAGNNAHSDISYPCAYQDVICVGSHDQTGKPSSFSNKGVQVDLMAPGTDILSTWPRNKRSKFFTTDQNYEIMSGTSQAAPIVTGVLAKLLSMGLTPSQARVKLLKGTRSKVQKDSSNRFGNIDYQNALKQSYTSFLYPLNKEAALINVNKKQTNLRLKVKNYGKPIHHAKINLIPQNSKIEIIESTRIITKTILTNEVMTFDYQITIPQEIDSHVKFDLEISSEDQTGSFVILGNLINFIHPEIDYLNAETYNIKKQLAPGTSIIPFTDLLPSNSVDYFVSRTEKNITKISILKNSNNGHIISREIPIRDRNPVFLNYTKLDIDNDGSLDYFIAYVHIDQDQKKITKFLLFNEDLQPKKYLIAPNNQFRNDKTFMPGQFKWIRLKEVYVPAWIGYGENGTETQQSPWEPPALKEKNYLYYLTKTGLKNVVIPDEEMPLHALFQNELLKKQGAFHFITSKGKGFFKTYYLYLYNNGIRKLSKIETTNFFDIFNTRPLPLNSNYSSGYFHETSNSGGQNIFTIKVKNDKAYTEFIKIENPFKTENIKFINHLTEDYIFFQTENKIAVYNRATKQYQAKESKVDTKRRKLKTLSSLDGIYLPASEAPGYTSDTLIISKSGKLLRHGQYKFMGINGCEEFGIVEKINKTYIGFSCIEKQKIFLIELSL